MRRRLLLALIVAAIAVCTGSRGADRDQPQFTRDGTSLQRAIIVDVAVPNQRQWEKSQALMRHPGLGFPTDWSFGEVRHMGRLYHVHELRWKTGEKAVIYFDLGEDELPRPNQAMQRTPSRTAFTFDHD
jgi:hypothetical protein